MYGCVYSNQSSRCDKKPCLAIPPAYPVQDKEGENFGWNFDGSIDELSKVDADTKTWDFETNPVV